MSVVTTEKVKSSLIVTLNRPEKRNALSPELIEAIKTALISGDEDKAVNSIIITGTDKAFCAGADLEYLHSLKKNSAAENEKDSRLLADLFMCIYNTSKPTLSAVNGPAIAGGCGLAIVCDYTIAHTQLATFGFTEVRIGFLPAIVSLFLIKRIGEYKARQLLLTGEIIHAANAHAIHLADELSETPLRRALEIADIFNANSKESIKRTKEMIRMLNGLSDEQALNYLQMMNASARFTDDFKNGLEKFLSKKEKSK